MIDASPGPPGDRRNSPGAGRRGTPPVARMGRAKWVAPSASRLVGRASGRDAPRHPAGERWRQRGANRSSRAAISSSLYSGKSSYLARDSAARDAALHRTRRPTHWASGGTPNPLGRPASDGTSNPLKWVARPARGSPASCRGAMAATKRESFLSRGDQFVSLLVEIVVSRAGQGGAGRRPASDETSNPLGIGRDAQPTGPPCIGRDVQPAQVGRASRPRLPGILPGSDGDNEARIVPLALWCVRVSLLATIVVTRAGQCGAGRRPASDGTPNPLGRPASGGTPNPPKWVARPARGSPASCRGAMAATKRESFLSRGDQFVSLLGEIVVTRAGQGGAGRRPASGGTPNPLGHPASGGTPNPPKWVAPPGARLPGILPGSDGDNDTGIVPLALWCVRVSLLATIVVSRAGQCGAGRRPASGGTPNPLGRPASGGTPNPLCRPASGGTSNPPKWVAPPGAMLPGILPGSDGGNETRIVPLALWCVRVSLLATIVVTRAGQGGAGRRPASDETSNPLGIGRDVQPTGHRTGRPTHLGIGRDVQPTGHRAGRPTHLGIGRDVQPTRQRDSTSGPRCAARIDLSVLGGRRNLK